VALLSVSTSALTGVMSVHLPVELLRMTSCLVSSFLDLILARQKIMICCTLINFVDYARNVLCSYECLLVPRDGLDSIRIGESVHISDVMPYGGY
jgi:hypothetical protein